MIAFLPRDLPWKRGLLYPFPFPDKMVSSVRLPSTTTQ